MCLTPVPPLDIIKPIDQNQLDDLVANKKLNGVRWLQCIKKHEILIEEANQCLD